MKEWLDINCPVSKEDFMLMVNIIPKTGCWEWAKSRQVKRGGYGQKMLTINNTRKLVRASRLAVWVFSGIWPHDKLVCHTCNNPSCCNPEHLYLGTYADNWKDTIKCGHAHHLPPIRPENVHCAKINYAIAEIIRKSNEPGPRISQRFGISKTMVSRIRRNLSWRTTT